MNRFRGRLRLQPATLIGIAALLLVFDGIVVLMRWLGVAREPALYAGIVGLAGGVTWITRRTIRS